MLADEYQRLAERTMDVHTTAEDRLLNAVLGLTGEAGEIADSYKKSRFHGHELSPEKLIDELGDVQWYIAQACKALGVSLSTVMERNVAKLQRRYPDGFSFERSRNREEAR